MAEILASSSLYVLWEEEVDQKHLRKLPSFSGKDKFLSSDKFGAALILPCPAQRLRWERAEGWGLPINRVILPSPARWMASKESYHLTHKPAPVLSISCPPGLDPVSVSASNVETYPLTLLSYPWPQWLLNQAYPPALLTSVEICVPSLAPWILTLYLNEMDVAQGEESRNICHYSLVLSGSLSSVRHSDQNGLHTQSSLSRTWATVSSTL